MATSNGCGTTRVGRSSGTRHECELAPTGTGCTRTSEWLAAKLSHQARIGEHDQTAFALGLMLDYARASGDTKFAVLTCGCKSSFFARFLRPSPFLLANFALCNMPQGGQHM
jgi:hypothetical protein